MGAENIVERLRDRAHDMGEVHHFYGTRKLMEDAAAEIVRLRGEVAQPEWTQDVIRCLSDIADEFGHTGRGNRRFVELLDRIRATPGPPAPAMPNGVKYDRELIARMLTELSSMGSSIFLGESISAQAELLIAADNRDAAGVEALPPDGAYMIVYDDQDMRPETFARSGARDAALYRFEQISGNWNAHLYAKIRSNTRDVDVPDAAPAAVPAGEAVAINYAVVHRFATENGLDYNRLAKLVRDSVYTTPPAPVQAAPQEGEDAAEAYRKAWEAGHAAALQHRGDSQEVGRG